MTSTTCSSSRRPNTRLGGTVDPNPGRRVLAQVMHDGPTMVANGVNAGGLPAVADCQRRIRRLFVPANGHLLGIDIAHHKYAGSAERY